MPIASSDGVDLYYERRGVGPRLLFLNGSGSTIEGSGLLLGAFAGPFDLVAWDYRGMGRSGVPPGPYDMSQCARDALAVLDAVGWDTTRVLGISFGGMVAQELAVTAPRRIERLALLCTSAGGEGGSSYPLHELERMTEDERNRARRQLIDTRFDPEWLASHPSDRDLVDAMERRASLPHRDANRATTSSSRRVATTTCGAGSPPSPAPPTWHAAASTGSLRRATVPRWPHASPEPSCTPTKVATPSWPRTPAASPT